MTAAKSQLQWHENSSQVQQNESRHTSLLNVLSMYLINLFFIELHSIKGKNKHNWKKHLIEFDELDINVY